jgi:hypothetical protein
MGYFGKLEEKKKAISLRKKGLSYSEIRKKVNVSKDTLSRWCRDVILSPEQLERLAKRKIEGSERGRIIGAKTQQDRRLKEIALFMDQGKKDIGSLTDRDKFLIGISLYVGEGGKGDHQIEFANSDPLLIAFMMNWFREFCKIPEHKFRGAIWIHDNLDQNVAKEYWSNLTKIPENQFFKTYIVKNKLGSKKIRKKLHDYGVFSIRISGAKDQRKILGWSYGILNQ